MDTLLNEREIWMKPTPEIQALKGKTIVVTEQDGSQWSATLQIGGADPNSFDAGKCSVALCGKPGVGHLEWTDAGKPRAVGANPRLAALPVARGPKADWRKPRERAVW